MSGADDQPDHDREEDGGSGEPGRLDEFRPERGAADARPERSRSGQDLAGELRLRPERTRVTRLSRRVLTILGGTAAIAIAAALLFALWPHGNKTGQELLSTDNKATPDGLNTLPRDYTGLPKPIPQLGPPLPGDLGRPMLNAGAPAPGMPQASTPPDPEAQRLAQERARLAQEFEAARTSRLFASEARAAVQPTVLTAGASPTPDLSGQSAAGTTTPTRQQSEGDRKVAFLNGDVDRRTVSPDRVQASASRNVVQAGAVIPAALLTGLRSDLPGQITAQVTEAVYDSPTGKILLIPQGARLIGQYDAQVQFGQSRALLVWNRIVFPNGRSIVLERQPGADPEGYAGLEDQIDNHWGQLFKAALLSTILSVGSEAGTSNNENSLVQAIRQGASNSFAQTGSQVVGRSLNIQPTITVRPGFPVRVIVTRDLVLEPYAS
ncbi:MAG: TrbI/VirB10 family protein [Sphingomonadaceae bacterium]|nr:TrbI/VirB10 family protein [Sphingomonadaceae bacterium]